MTILISDLREAASRTPAPAMEQSFFEKLTHKKQTAFLCHSHKDSDLANGLQTLIVEDGWSLSIDCQSIELPDKPSQVDTDILKNKIIENSWFLFLATPNSLNSKWCSWSIGYADAKKDHSKILIVPTKDQEGDEFGCEYRRLYSRLDTGSSMVKLSGFALYEADSESGTWINKL
ncbi:MAG: toll/interleukin-1 receptor domain-containing protein [Gammaproteobacteria bacterium]|nr:toll/interleukin-1 receptor domain-containing protein [Gammaproteobacteria bacterium]